MKTNKLQKYKLIFFGKYGFVLNTEKDTRIVKIKSYKNRISANREAEKLLKRYKMYSVSVFEIKNKKDNLIKEIKNEK